MRNARCLAGIALVLAAGMAYGQASVDVSAFPTLSLADGRSTVTISATVRLTDGRLAPDGTRVVFSTDRGSFRNSVAETRNGVARGILQTGTEAGFAKVTASVLSYRASATMDYEYVSDRSLLSSANEFVRMTSNGPVRYSMDQKIAEATSPDQKAEVNFRDITITADRIQLNVPTYEVRAKNAIVRIKDQEVKCSELYFKLNMRLGYGLTTFTYRPKVLEAAGNGFRFVEGDERTTYGVAEIRSGQLKAPELPVRGILFDFADVDDSVSIINASNLIAYPRKEVQFQKADVTVGGAHILRQPLYKVSVYNSSPVFTDQIIKINDNQLAIDYPQYLALAPGFQSLFRLQMGQGSGRGINSSRGIFLGYEMNWNRGDDFQGAFALRSLGRDDWGAGLQQYWRIDPNTDMSAQIDFPAHSSLFGNVNINRTLPYGLTLHASGSDNRSVRGLNYRSQSYMLSLDKDPVKVANLPVTFSYGLTMQSLRSQFGDLSSSQNTSGLTSTLRMNPVFVNRDTSVNATYTLSKLYGSNAPSGFAQNADLTLNTNFNFGGLSLSYDYFADGLTDSLLGQHQLSARGNLYFGNLAVNGLIIRGLDQSRFSVQADAGYRFNHDFSLRYGYTFDKVFADSYMDYYFILGYKLGYREFGLTWSQRTKRIGFQLLGTALN